MREINGSLKDLLLKEDVTNETKFQVMVDGENFQVTPTVGKDGISLELTPVSPGGDMILNLSEDELQNLQSSLKTSLDSKFGKYRMKISGDESNSMAKTITFKIPQSSLMEFLKGVMSK